jgi:hypothetical protein
MINPSKLHRELERAGLPVESVAASGRIDYSRALVEHEKALAENICGAHDPRDYVAERQANAMKEAADIPGWSGWTSAQAVSWIENNVHDLDSVRQALKAMARLLIAMRNELYPDLAGEGDDSDTSAG